MPKGHSHLFSDLSSHSLCIIATGEWQPAVVTPTVHCSGLVSQEVPDLRVPLHVRAFPSRGTKEWSCVTFKCIKTNSHISPILVMSNRKSLVFASGTSSPSPSPVSS